MDEKQIQDIVAEVFRKLGKDPGRDPGDTSPSGSPGPSPASSSRAREASRYAGARHFGIFDDPKEACRAAHDAFVQLSEKGIEGRRKVIDIVKSLAEANAEAWGREELEETRIGRLDHKIEKLRILKLVPGVEFIQPYGMSGDHGITMEEYTPFGLVGAVTPATHSVPTMSGNIINMVAAGNSCVFNPHPGAALCAAHAARAYNEAIHRELGVENLICVIEKPTLESFDANCADEHVRLLCITGGPAVVQAAMKTGKRAICAGPGNPPVVVTCCADHRKAARNVIRGAAYDNNLLCIGEKEVFVIDRVADEFMSHLEREGAARLNATQIDKLKQEAFTRRNDNGASHAAVNKDLVGRDAAVLGQRAGVQVPAKTELLFGETGADDVFVEEEQMMPFLPIVRVKDIDEAIRRAGEAEHNYKHTAIIHTRNVDHMTAMARALDTSLFIKNGSSMAGLGLGGEGYLSYSIATPTGEGVTNPKTFTRTRRCVMVDNLKIY